MTWLAAAGITAYQNFRRSGLAGQSAELFVGIVALSFGIVMYQLFWHRRILVPVREAAALSIAASEGQLPRRSRFSLRVKLLIAFATLTVFAGSFSATSGVFFAFLAGAPFVVVNGLGLSPTIYGLAFIVISLAYAAGNFVTARYAQRLGVIRLLILGTTVTLAGAAGSLAAVLALPLHIATLFGPAMLMAATTSPS